MSGSRPAARKARRRRNHDCSAYTNGSLPRRQRKRVPPMAILLKAVVAFLMSLSDMALRVYLARARFASRRFGLSYPKFDVLLRALGSPKLYTCWHCGGLTASLTDFMKEKRRRYQGAREQILSGADRELHEAGLIQHVEMKNHFAVFSGMQLTLPDGSIHRIPPKAPRGTFFIIPDHIYASGAPAIWSRKKQGFLPVSSCALKLLVLLLSEENHDEYGGINPRLIHVRSDGSLHFQSPLIDWEPAILKTALDELERRCLLTRVDTIISAVGGHLIRKNDIARYADELRIQIFCTLAF